MRTVLLPSTSPVLHREAYANWLQFPNFDGNFHTLASLLEDHGDLLVGEFAEIASYWARTRLRIASRTPYYDPPAVTVTQRLMTITSEYARPIIHIPWDHHWVRDKVHIRSEVNRILEELDYPNREEKALELQSASEWSKLDFRSGGYAAYPGMTRSYALGFRNPDYRTVHTTALRKVAQP